MIEPDTFNIGTVDIESEYFSVSFPIEFGGVVGVRDYSFLDRVFSLEGYLDADSKEDFLNDLEHQSEFADLTERVRRPSTTDQWNDLSAGERNVGTVQIGTDYIDESRPINFKGMNRRFSFDRTPGSRYIEFSVKYGVIEYL